MHPGAGIASLAGLLTVAGPLYFAPGDALGVSLQPIVELRWDWQPWLLLFGCFAITAGGLAMNPSRRWDQQLATAGLVAALAAIGPQLIDSPGVALAVALASTHLAIEAWTSDRPVELRLRSQTPTHEDLTAAAARSACGTALVGWQLVWVVDRLTSPGGLGPALLALLGAWVFVAKWLTAAWSRRRFARWLLAGAALLSASVVLLSRGDVVSTALALAIVPGAALLVIPIGLSQGPGREDTLAVLFERPAYLLVATFGAVCVGGAVLLALPVASATGVSVGWVDAAFTAVSAVCVTGLIVLDTPNDFSAAGQGLLLLLTQIGGLGIMTYSTAVLVMLGRRLGLREESVLAATIAARDRSDLQSSLGRLLTLTFASEAVGAALFAGLFLQHGEELGSALWRGLFTAVSAFCNAGFALQSDSLIAYRQDPGVLHVTAALIVLGGLSPAVVYAFVRRCCGRWARPTSSPGRTPFSMVAS